MKLKVIDNFSFIVAGLILLLCLIVFFNETNQFWGSLGAALMAAFLSWCAYVITRWLVLALWK